MVEPLARALETTTPRHEQDILCEPRKGIVKSLLDSEGRIGARRCSELLLHHRYQLPSSGEMFLQLSEIGQELVKSIVALERGAHHCENVDQLVVCAGACPWLQCFDVSLVDSDGVIRA